MPMKFQCHSCRQEIFIQFLKPGEKAVCKNCGTINVVPETAEEIGEVPESEWGQPSPPPPETPPPVQPSFLGPKDFGVIFEETFRIYGRGFWSFVFLMFIIQVPIGIITYAMELESEATGFGVTGSSVPILLLLLIIIYSIIIGPLVVGAINILVSQYFLGLPIRSMQGISYAAQRLGSLIGAALLIGIITIVLAITIIGFPVAVFLWISWLFFASAIVLERRPVQEALSRSYHLVKGHWWRTFGICLLYGVFLGIPGMILQFVYYPLSVVYYTLTYPLLYIVMVQLYFDMRVRKDGYTPERLKTEYATAAGYGQSSTSSGSGQAAG